MYLESEMCYKKRRTKAHKTETKEKHAQNYNLNLACLSLNKFVVLGLLTAIRQTALPPTYIPAVCSEEGA